MKAGGISVHAVDVAAGRPAEGLRVEVVRIDPEPAMLADGRLTATGVLDHPVTEGDGIVPGEYIVRFHIGAFFGDETGFLRTVPFRFAIVDAAEHFHLPLKFTRWGFALFRGA